MKKLYCTPELQVVFVETMQMIAESMTKNETDTKSFGSSLSRESDWEE